MDIKRLMLAGFLLIVVLLGINFWPPSAPPEAVPDFAAYARVAEKKQAFFDFVRPSIQIENSLILAERQALLAIKASAPLKRATRTLRLNKSGSWLRSIGSPIERPCLTTKF